MTAEDEVRGGDIVVVDNVNFSPNVDFTGGAINWLTQETCDCDTVPFHFNVWANGGTMAFFFPVQTPANTFGGVSSGTNYAVLAPGATIGPSSTFIVGTGSGLTINWRQAAGVDGYLGFRFQNTDTGQVNYGYARLTTTGTTGYPMTIVSYAYNQAGNPITIPLPAGEEIEVTPETVSVTLTAGDAASEQISIANVGSGTLTWDIETDDLPFGSIPPDPALDEVLDVPDFTIDSPANGGSPAVFTIPGGVLTSGQVVGFSFEGTVAGISGSGSWASDMCMTLEGPDGSVYNVGGFSAAIPGCDVNPWDFDGSGSTDDGTYASTHEDAWPFPPGAQDAGDWTVTFVNGWDSTSAATMNWSDVTITLHKITPPEPCSDPNSLSWLSVDPASGSTAGGASSPVDVLVDAADLAAGSYEAYLCVNSNDSVGNELVVVPVEVTVVAPSITVDPAAISASADAGQSTTETLTIGNAGVGDLSWEIQEAPETAANPRAHFPSVSRPVTPGNDRHLASAEAATPSRALLDKLALTMRSDPNSKRGGGGVPAYSIAAFTFDSYASLDALAPGVVTPISTPRPNTVYAQTFVDYDFSRHFFIASAPATGANLPVNAYGWVDTATGAVTQLGTVSGGPGGAVNWGSASWDPATGQVYALSSPNLYTIDTVTGAATLVGTISGPGVNPAPIFIAIAFSSDGLLYGMEIADDVLLAIDKTNAQASIIGSTGIPANFAQDMDFDHSTGVLYWAGFTGTSGADADSRMFTIDTSTGAATLIGPVENRAELVSFSVAVSGGNCSDPADVPWLSVDQTDGTIPSGGADQEVTVTLDAASLTDGVYNASLCVLSNDPARPRVEVPVEFTVGEPPKPDVIFANGFECAEGLPGCEGGGEDIVVVDNVNFSPNADFTGGSINWLTQATCDCDTAPFHFNIWGNGGMMAFFFPVQTPLDTFGAVTDGGNYAVLGSGATIGPSSTFAAGTGAALTANWRQSSGVDGYLGFRFQNTDTGQVNYGYARLTTTGTTGYPVTIVSYAYNQVGDPITIP